MKDDRYGRSIITDIKYRMAFAAIREFADAGSLVSGLHFGAPDEKPPAAYSRYLSEFRTVKRATADLIFEYAETQAGAVIFPLASATIEALAAADPKSRGRLLVPPAQSLRTANDKYSLRALAKSLGVPVPEQYDSPQTADRFPLVVKYRNGEALGITARDRYRIVNDADTLAEVYAKFCSIAADKQSPPLIQEYLDGEAIGVSAVFGKDSFPVSVICHKRLREYPITGGPSSCCVSVWDEEIVDYAIRLLKALNWRGVAMVEFKDRRLLEINPRVWGSFPLVRAAHSGFAQAYLRAARGENLPVCSAPDYQLGKKMQFFFSDIAAARDYMRAGMRKQAFRALGDAINPFVRDGVLELRDPVGSAAYVAGTLGRIGEKL